MKRIALLCPNDWDTDHLARCRDRWEPEYTILTHGEGAEHAPGTFDALTFIDQTVQQFRDRSIDGVTSSSDYPGCLVAAAVAQELGLAGPRPKAVLRCSHKYYSRVVQAEAVPEATPGYALIDPDWPDDCPLPFPIFVKPVKSWFSQHARRIESPEDLRRFVALPEVRAHLSTFVSPFNQLIERYTDFAHNGRYLLAEECLSGVQVTVEGYIHEGRVTIFGITDSVMYPGTISFHHFEYPSTLPAEVLARMTSVAERVIPPTGLDEALFNIEMFYDQETDRISIIEINPRMCGQFADLMEMVNGTNTYEILLALAASRTVPTTHPGGSYSVAASFALREFGDRLVRHMPTELAIEAVKRDYPVTLVQTYYREGQRLSDEDQSDGYSYRYAVINMAAPDRATLLSTFEEVKRRLGFAFDPVD